MVVSDQMPSLWPVEVEFVPGEQPSDTKLTGWALQTGAGLDKVARAVGDLWGDRWDTNVLDIHYYAAPNIANISRLIGSASLLNPVMPSRETVTVTFVASAIPAGVHQFNMRTSCGAPPYLEWSTSNVLFSYVQVPATGGLVAVLQALPGGTFTTFKTSVDLLSTAGDFTIDTQGTVTSYSVTGTYSGSKTYDTVLAPDMYDGASMNVIPNPLATSSQRCTISGPSGVWYTITLPSITVTPIPNPGGVAGVSCGPSTSQDIPPELYQARLPLALTDSNCMGLGSGDLVPGGFMYLWDAVNEEIVNNLTFRMTATDYTIEASGAALTVGSNRYCLVTVGTSITGVIANMSRRLYSHDHTDPGGGRPISHSSLLNMGISQEDISSLWSIDAYCPPSRIAGNDHPQYLIRYGWRSSLVDHPTLCDNAMLGDLFMAAAVDYTGGTYSGSTDDSRKIYFGHTTRYIMYEQAYTALTLRGFGLTLPESNITLSSATGVARYISSYNTSASTTRLMVGYDGTYYGLFTTIPSATISIRATGTSSNVNVVAQSTASLQGNTCQLTSGAAQLTLNPAGSAESVTLYTSDGNITLNVAGTSKQLLLETTHTTSPGNVSIRRQCTTGGSSYHYINLSTNVDLYAYSGNINLNTRTGAAGRINLTADGNIGLAAGAGSSDIEMYVARTIIIPNGSGHPAAGSEVTGMMYYDTGDNRLHIYNGSWKTVLLS